MSGIAIAPRILTLSKGQKGTFVATPSAGVVWASTSPAVATVDAATGVVKVVDSDPVVKAALISATAPDGKQGFALVTVPVSTSDIVHELSGGIIAAIVIFSILGFALVIGGGYGLYKVMQTK